MYMNPMEAMAMMQQIKAARDRQAAEDAARQEAEAKAEAAKRAAEKSGGEGGQGEDTSLLDMLGNWWNG